jgi:hypothetical protein
MLHPSGGYSDLQQNDGACVAERLSGSVISSPNAVTPLIKGRHHMGIGQPYLHVLTADQREALEASIDLLIDACFEDITAMADGRTTFADSQLAIFLPPRYLPKYTIGFARRFFVTLVTVAWKLAQPEQIPLACVAEELVAWALIRRARVYLDLYDKPQSAHDFTEFIDVLFADVDFLFLYEPAYDGIDQTEIGARAGMTSLAFADWFHRFGAELDTTYGAVHPYAEEGPPPDDDKPDDDEDAM